MISRFPRFTNKDSKNKPSIPILEKDEDAVFALECILNTTTSTIMSGRYCNCFQRMSPTFKDDQPEYLDSDFLFRS